MRESTLWSQLVANRVCKRFAKYGEIPEGRKGAALGYQWDGSQARKNIPTRGCQLVGGRDTLESEFGRLWILYIVVYFHLISIECSFRAE